MMGKATIGKQLWSTLLSSSGAKIVTAALAGVACIGIIAQAGVSGQQAGPAQASPAKAFMVAGFPGESWSPVRPAAASAGRHLDAAGSGPSAQDAATPAVRVIPIARQEQLSPMRQPSWALRSVEQPQAARASRPATASMEGERETQTAELPDAEAASAQRARAARMQQRAARERAQEARRHALREAADARAEVRQQEARREVSSWGHSPADHSRMPIYDGYGRLVSPHAR